MGKNSPIVLTLGKDNYEALIERHGQWIRWRSASKCSCVQSGNMQPDIRCPFCSGRGYTYKYQKSQIVYENTILQDAAKQILTLNSDKEDCELIEVYDFNGNRLENAEKNGLFVTLNESHNLVKGTYYTVVLRKKIEQELEQVQPIKNNLGYYIIEELKVGKTNIDGLYHNSVGDILHIDKITDANGLEYEPKEFRLNQFRIENHIEETIDDETGEKIITEIPIAEPITCQGIKYIPPFIFALLNQNLSQADIQAVADFQGDAVLTFPYECDVSNDDVLTVLSGSYTNKEVMIRQDCEFDVLGVYFVYDIISCTGIQNGQIVEYKEGIDFVIVANNKIKWLETENSNYPDVSDTYSISYHVLPTYKVVKQIPQLRTSENQRFPKKAVVKLFTTYSEKLGANIQAIGRNGYDGSY